MSTATANRLAKTNGVNEGPHYCGYKGCKAEFPTEAGLRMHVGRKHTGTIPSAWDKSPRKFRNSLKTRPIGRPRKVRKTWSAARRARFEQRKAGTNTSVNATTSQCVITGDGFRLEFSAKFVPTILHTVALSIGGKEQMDVQA